MAGQKKSLPPQDFADAVVAGWTKRLAGKGRNDRDRLLARLKGLLSFLDETFIKEPMLRKPEHRHWRFRWPSKEDLVELDQLVWALAGQLRKKPMLQHAAYDVASAKFPKLELAAFVKRLCNRISELKLPPPPSRNPAALHLERIRELAAKTGGKTSSVAAEFLSDHQAVLNGRKKLSQVRWSKYRELFYQEGTSRIRLENHTIPVLSNSDIECYARYLELHRGELLWLQDSQKWLEAGEEREPLWDWVERNERRDEELIRDHTDQKRAKARFRKEKERELKKARQKSVTHDPDATVPEVVHHR